MGSRHFSQTRGLRSQLVLPSGSDESVLERRPSQACADQGQVVSLFCRPPSHCHNSPKFEDKKKKVELSGEWLCQTRNVSLSHDAQTRSPHTSQPRTGQAQAISAASQQSPGPLPQAFMKPPPWGHGQPFETLSGMEPHANRLQCRGAILHAKPGSRWEAPSPLWLPALLQEIRVHHLPLPSHFPQSSD